MSKYVAGARVRLRRDGGAGTIEVVGPCVIVVRFDDGSRSAFLFPDADGLLAEPANDDDGPAELAQRG